MTQTTSTLLNAVTATTTGTAVPYAGNTQEGDVFFLKVTATGPWSVYVSLQQQLVPGGPYVDLKIWTVSGGASGYADNLSLITPECNMRGIVTLVSGAATVSLTSLTTTTSSSLQAPFIPPGGQTAVASILAPNGTIATNGTVTLGTALPAIYANAWCYFPAAAVSGGAAGMYFVKFSSTTVGQVYTNFVDASTTAFTPYIPSTLVAAVGSNSAYTQTTAADLTLANVTIAGSSMGLNGGVRSGTVFSVNNTAGNKIWRYKFGGTNSLANTITTVSQSIIGTIRNRGLLNSQFNISGGDNNTVGNLIYGTLDTSINQPLTFTGQLATATDYIVLEGFTIEILPA